MKHCETFRKAIVAGIFISLAGWGMIARGDFLGIVAFSFGLLAIINYQFKLFTGTAGFFQKGEFGSIWLILLGNIAGCLMVALLARLSPLGVQDGALKILEGRLATGWWKCGLLAIGCGMIMTTAVQWGRKGIRVVVVLGVVLFIICGFPHCVADAFYYLCAPAAFLKEHAGEVLLTYVSIVAGNFIGCNLIRALVPEA